jgi:hypothetical protein
MDVTRDDGFGGAGDDGLRGSLHFDTFNEENRDYVVCKGNSYNTMDTMNISMLRGTDYEPAQR